MSNNTGNMSTGENGQKNQYFDLHTLGYGYLNRFRVVPVERGKPFLAVGISALQGSHDNMQYTRFDCRISGSKAQHIIQEMESIINDGSHRVLVKFKLSDLYPDIFPYKHGDKAGQPGYSLKSRLLTVELADNNIVRDQSFDLTTYGLGYLNETRVVPVENENPFLEVDVSALHGHRDNVQYTRFDTRVAGEKAQYVIDDLMPTIKDRSNKVLAGFKLGGLYPQLFTHDDGDKAGQHDISLKSRLLDINWVKVNGNSHDIALDEKPADEKAA